MATLWERVKSGSKVGLDKTWQALDKVGAPVNRLSNKLGSEAFWPTTLDKECDKAARILKSFCRDGFYAEDRSAVQDGPKQTQRIIKKIPTDVIAKAKGLAIFTTMRTGLWFSGAGGSGVLIARKEDGSWSPPSGILLHTAGLGFMVGIDIYDCVVVINSEKALEAFYKVRCTLGSEISVAAGPVGAGGVLETELHKRQAPVFTYMKSRGFYAGVQIDGTVIIERTDENERFYGQRIGVKDILGGKVRHPPFEVRRLLETIKAAQGDNNFDESVLPSEPPPGDFDVDDGRVFGVPDREDPDPYGVLALEKEGMRVVEAGTHERASWEQFSFNPSPTSPVHPIYNRDSVDYRRSISHRGSWRASTVSGTPTTPTRPSSLRQSVELPVKKSSMVDSSTQTEVNDEDDSPALDTMHTFGARGITRSASNSISQPMQKVPENGVMPINTDDAAMLEVSDQADNVSHPAKLESDSGIAQTGYTGYTTPPTTPPMKQVDPAIDHDDVEIVHPSIQTIQLAKPIASPVVSKARLVTVAKRIPPKLPPRNPTRSKLNGSPDSKASDAISVNSTSHELEPLPATLDSTIESAHSHEATHADSTVDSAQAQGPSQDESIHSGDAAPGDTDELIENASAFEDVALSPDVHESKRISTLSTRSNGSSTWDKVRAMRQIDDDD